MVCVLIPIRSPWSFRFWLVHSIKSMLELLNFRVVGFGPVGAPFDLKFSVVNWIERNNFIKVVVLRVKGIYTTEEEFNRAEEYDKRLFYYKVSPEEIIKMSEKNDSMGKEYMLVVFPRYYENTFDPLAVVFSAFASPRNLLSKLEHDREWYNYEEILRGFKYYTFSAFMKALYRCKLGLPREKILELLSESGYSSLSYPALATIFRKLADIGMDEYMGVVIVFNFTRRKAVLMAVSD